MLDPPLAYPKFDSHISHLLSVAGCTPHARGMLWPVACLPCVSKYMFVSDEFHRTKFRASRLPYKRKNETRVVDDMRAAVGRERAMRASKSRMRGNIHAERSDGVRLRIEESRVRAHQPHVRRSRSPTRREVTHVHTDRPLLESCEPRVGRACARLHTSWTHVDTTIPGVD